MKWLSDEALNECEKRLKAQGFSDFCDTVRACAQAREVNRLREGLEALHTELKLFGDLSGGYTCERILELLEGA